MCSCHTACSSRYVRQTLSVSSPQPQEKHAHIHTYVHAVLRGAGWWLCVLGYAPPDLDQVTVTPLRLDGASVTGMWEGWAGTPALHHCLPRAVLLGLGWYCCRMLVQGTASANQGQCLSTTRHQQGPTIKPCLSHLPCAVLCCMSAEVPPLVLERPPVQYRTAMQCQQHRKQTFLSCSS